MTPGAIARYICTQTLARKCVVLVDNCNWTGHECDVLAVTTDLRIIDIEIKISRADFKRDAAKDKWWSRKFIGYGERKETFNDKGRLIRVDQPALYDSTHREHPPKVWKHYFAMPKEIWTPDLVQFLPSQASGVLLISEQRINGKLYLPAPIVISCERRATPAKDAYKLKPEQVMDIARLANLRMWAAYKEANDARAHG